MADWSPDRYLRFADERTRAARDLLAQVPHADPAFVVDAGCGPGNSTELLAERWPRATVAGFDTSPAMLAEARTRLPGATFSIADVATYAPDRPVDVLFANAVLQWVPHHVTVLRRLMGTLAPGGALAVQMPDNLGEPSHRLMAETAAAMPFAARLAGAARAPLPPVRTYWNALRPFVRSLDVWHTVYNHPLDGPGALVDFVRSTGLKPFLDPLDEGERADFLAAYEARIAEAYPPADDGRVLFRFPRLFLVAIR